MEKTPYDDGLEKICTLFNLRQKSEVRKYCKSLVIRSEDFAMLLKVARIGGVEPYKYACHFYQWAPRDAEPNQQDLDALTENGVGPLSDGGRKTMRKVMHIFQTRKQIGAHFFFLPSHARWHLFYFNQQDMRKFPSNHWEAGPHIHYSRESYTRDSMRQVWEKLNADPPIFPGGEHIRYDAAHNRLEGKP